jgi:hypothetical protein
VINMFNLSSKVTKFGLLTLMLSAFYAVSCGGGGEESTKHVGYSDYQKVIHKKSSDNGIPSRILLAVGYIESRLSPTPSQALYVNPTTSEDDGIRGLPIAETAFGISSLELGLEGNSNKQDLLEQVSAYAAWIRSKVDEQNVNLPLELKTTEDKIRWIWEVSQYHRVGTRVRNDVRSIFARELVKVLNNGFYWQNEDTGETIKLPPESPAIMREDMPEAYQTLLQLGTSTRTDIPNVEFLPLATLIGEEGNRPNHVEVIHCPLSLSGCLELQTQLGDGDIKMEAHYIIPSSRDIIDGPIQIARHSRAVKLTDHQGNHRLVDNAIVVMLVGNSGRFENGYRVDANPKWLNKQQIVDLTSVIGSVCELLKEEGATTLSSCLTLPVDRPRMERELLFQTPIGASYRWGDLPDYDPRIFESYLKNYGTKLPGAASFSKDIYKTSAGKGISMKLGFTDRVRLVVYERLVRCPDRSLKWAKIYEEQVRATTSSGLAVKLWDSGPNKNGTQYFRAKVYSKDQLIGWDISEIYLTSFETENQDEMIHEVCR